MKRTAAVVVLLLAAGVAVWRLSPAPELALPRMPETVEAPARELIEQAERFAREKKTGAAVGELGMAYHAAARYEEAEACYALASSLEGGNWRWHYGRVLVGEYRGELEPSIELLERVTALNPTLAIGWYRLGQARFKRGEGEQAKAALERVLADAELGAHATVPMARMLMQSGREREALALLREQAVRFPQHGPLHRMLAQVYRQLGEEHDADWHDRVAGLMPGGGPPADAFAAELADQSRSRLFLSEQILQAGRRGDLARKVRLLRRAREFYPEDAGLREMLAASTQAASAAAATVDETTFESGRAVYAAVCALCHGPDGAGLEDRAPPLAGSAWLKQSPPRLIRIVLDGVRSEGPFARQMPSLRALEDEQIAAVLQYARARWCNDPGLVTAAEVKRVREQTVGRERAWSREELMKVPESDP